VGITVIASTAAGRFAQTAGFTSVAMKAYPALLADAFQACLTPKCAAVIVLPILEDIRPCLQTTNPCARSLRAWKTG
jgi:hypothetical protein